MKIKTKSFTYNDEYVVMGDSDFGLDHSDSFAMLQQWVERWNAEPTVVEYFNTSPEWEYDRLGITPSYGDVLETVESMRIIRRPGWKMPKNPEALREAFLIFQKQTLKTVNRKMPWEGKVLAELAERGYV